MKKYFFVLLFISAILLISCGAVRLIPFNSENLQLGMNKKAVVTKFGRADKESFHTDESGILHETLYYSAVILRGEIRYSYDNILEFKEGKLISLSQGPEVRSSDRKITIQKEN